MDVNDKARKTAIKYITPYFESEESIKVIPPEEIKSNSKLYPQGKFHLNQDVLIVRPAEGYTHMDMQSIYDELPNNLAEILLVDPYKNPNGSGLIPIVSLNMVQVDYFDDAVGLNTLNIDGFEDFLLTVKEDLEYTNNQSGIIQILEVSDTSSIVNVHKDILVGIDSHGKHTDQRNIMTYLSGKGLYCNKYIDYTDPYYKLEIKPRRKSKLKDTRELFIEFNRSTFELECPDCHEQSVVVSYEGICYCVDCEEEKASFGGESIPLNEPITKIIDNWTEYTSVIDPEGTHDFKIEEEEFLLESQDKEIYISEYGAFTRGTTLYTQLGAHDVWVPFHAQDKQIRVYERDKKAYVCYNCAEKKDQTYFRVRRVWIPLKADILHGDGMFVCKDCKESFQQEFDELVENTPELDSKIVSHNL